MYGIRYRKFKASTHSHIVRDQIVDRLRSKSMDIEYMVFEDEGHGFTKYSNLVKALKKSAEFLVEKLS
jgi:dipeptidyl aminopeptidase/acylaminoacyl peptidase